MHLEIDINKYWTIAREKRPVIFSAAFIMFMFTVLTELTVIGFSPSGETTAVMIFFKLIRYCSYLLCLIKIMLDLPDYLEKKERFAFYLAAGLISAAASLVCGNRTMALYFLLFMAAEDMDSGRIIKMAVILQACVLVICVLLSQTNLITDHVFDPETRRRHSLGFLWTTTGPILFLFIQLEYIYLKEGALRIREMIAMLLIAAWFFWMTDTKMAFLVSVAIPLFFFFLKKQIDRGCVLRKINKGICAFPWIMAVISVLLHAVYNGSNGFMQQLNALLSDRLELGYRAIQQYGFTLLGNPNVEWLGYSLGSKEGVYNYVDCSYLQISLEYGLLFLVVILLIYGYLLYASLKKGKYDLCWIILFILAFSFTEPRLVNLAFNPMILLCVSETQLKDRKTKEIRR